MMRGWLAVIALLWFALQLTGCGNPAAALIGNWQLETPGLPAEAGNNPLAQQIASQFSMNVEFTAEGEMHWKFAFLGQEKQQSGQWKYEGQENSVMVIQVKPEGKTESKEVSITFVKPDVIELIPPQGAPKQGTLRFRKVEK